MVFSVVMRREQILKICLNHSLTHDIEYKAKDSKSWHFVVNDYSEGEVELSQFCLRFKNEEVANGFKKAIDDALNGVTSKQNGTSDHVDTTVPRISAADRQTAEEKENIKTLSLPENFYEYKSSPKCTGCRGCHSEEFKFSEAKITNQDFTDENPLPLVMPKSSEPNDLSKNKQPASSVFVSNTPAFNSPAQSSFIFGTPTKPAETKSIFGGANATKPTDTPTAPANPTPFSFTSTLLGNSSTAADAPQTNAAPAFSLASGKNAFGTPTVTTTTTSGKSMGN